MLRFPEQRTMINGGVDGGTGSVNYTTSMAATT